MSSSDLEKRIAEIERRLSAKHSSAFRILLVTGGLPGGPAMAHAGAHKWYRERAETLEHFTERAAQAALALSEPSLIVGGLPDSLEEMGFATFDEWWNTVAADYPDV